MHTFAHTHCRCHLVSRTRLTPRRADVAPSNMYIDKHVKIHTWHIQSHLYGYVYAYTDMCTSSYIHTYAGPAAKISPSSSLRSLKARCVTTSVFCILSPISEGTGRRGHVSQYQQHLYLPSLNARWPQHECDVSVRMWAT